MRTAMETSFRNAAILLFALIIQILLTPAAYARTAAMQSLADTSAVITATLDPNSLKSASERYAEECNSTSENYRVHTAAIYGDNNLDDNQYKRQCESPLGREAPPTGLFYKLRDGRRYPMGSGDLVHQGDIVVTASHNLRRNGEDLVLPTDELVFAIYEKDGNGICQRKYYPVENVALGTNNSQTLEGKGNDFAVIKLKDAVQSYEPLKLPTPSEFEMLISEIIESDEPELTLSAFGHHESIGNGDDLALVNGNAYRITDETNNYYSVPNAIIHNIDSIGSMSGASLSTQRHAPKDSIMLVGGIPQNRIYDRFFLGIHVAGVSSNEGVEFDIKNEYSVGILINDKLREMISEAADEPVLRTAEAPIKKTKRSN